MSRNLRNGDVKALLRIMYNMLFGPGFWDQTTQDVYLWTWQMDPDNGPARVWIDIMVSKGGDNALRERRQAAGLRPMAFDAVPSNKAVNVAPLTVPTQEQITELNQADEVEV